MISAVYRKSSANFLNTSLQDVTSSANPRFRIWLAILNSVRKFSDTVLAELIMTANASEFNSRKASTSWCIPSLVISVA